MKEVLKKKIETMEDTRDFAQRVLDSVSLLSGHATVLTLSGDLGAGKTTFMKVFLSLFGIQENDVTSPTFVIQKRYTVESHGFTSVVHIDAYRIEDIRELETIRWSNLLQEENTLICIEWPEKIKEAIPSYASAIVIDHKAENEREFALLM